MSDETNEQSSFDRAIGEIRAAGVEWRKRRDERIDAMLKDHTPGLIRLKDPEIDNLDDCVRIQSVLAARGVICNETRTAWTLWTRHSEMLAASWLILPEDDETLARDVLGVLDDGELVKVPHEEAE